MSLMTDVDIRRALGKDIVIEPFSSEALTPVGYDFMVGDFVFSWEHGLLQPNADGDYDLPPKSTIQILTKESLWVSGRVGGTLHSKVLLVSKGLSHISTTLDPGWYGPLLITFHNNRDQPILLRGDETFVTLVFLTVNTPTKTKPRKSKFSINILLKQLSSQHLLKQLSSQQTAYINKIGELLGDSESLDIFNQKVEEANQPMPPRVVNSERRKLVSEIGRNLASFAVIMVIVALATLNMYWGRVSEYFEGEDYGIKVLAFQITAIIALSSLLLNIRKR